MAWRAHRIAAVCGAVASVVLSIACSKARPVANDVYHCTSWKDEIEPVFAGKCRSCHSSTAPAGGYDLSTYLAALGPGTDSTPNAIAGDSSSRVLRFIEPGSADGIHESFTDLYQQVSSWVVDCRVSYFRSAIHPGGILDRSDSEGFHGAQLRRLDWQFQICADCHGDGSSGGKSRSSCVACHAEGPTACSTCHANVSATGAHQVHLSSTVLQRPLDCSECHVKPTRYDDLNHIVTPEGLADQLPAEVTFGLLAGTAPSWDPTAATCSNVACHGSGFNDSNAKNPRPTWAPVAQGLVTCDRCHGFPPSTHASGQCSACHARVVDASGKIKSPPLHMNGKVEIGDGTDACSTCHGNATSAAPPKDLTGNVSSSAIGVGTHRVHLEATHRLRGPIPCGDCHLVPNKTDSPGHIDTEFPAEVFPAAVSSTSLAAADGALPAWDRTSATCSNVYCHGSGSKLTRDAAAGLNRQPVWTAINKGQAACGACHGIPPADGLAGHTAGSPLTSCVSCHPATVDAFGNILVTGPSGSETSAHINGVFDVR